MTTPRDTLPGAGRSLATFLILTAALSVPWLALLIHADKLDIGRGFPIHMLMWAPGLAAIATVWLWKLPWSILGFQWPGGRYLAAGYLLPVLYSLIAYLLLWETGLAAADLPGFEQASRLSLRLSDHAAVLNVFLIMTFGVVQSAASAAGEEIGWRGLLVPLLACRMRFAGVITVSGIIWAAWHFPVIIWSAYTSGAPKPYALLCFTVMIVATGGMAGWLRLRSGSVWPAVVLHACHNAVIQWVLDPMTIEGGRADLFAGEFGAVLAIVTAIGLIPFLVTPAPTAFHPPLAKDFGP